jgi:hypothetical protein
MLQTRLYPYFQGEGKRLMFAAAPLYLRLVQFCIYGGLIAALSGFVAPAIGIPLPPYDAWWVLTGSMVAAAGVLAAMSLPMISFDLRERVYRRRDGTAAWLRQTRGRLDDLDAVVVTAHRSVGASVIAGSMAIEFRLTLHWRGGMAPPLLLAMDHRSVPPNTPFQAGGAQMLALGQRVASALQVRLYDNSHMIS